MRSRQIKPGSRALRPPATLEELETQLLKSVNSLEAGKGVDGGQMIKRLRKRMRKAHGRK